MDAIFTNRFDAGRKLADALPAYQASVMPLVLGLPRGGVPVAFEVACKLNAPLDIFVVRKLGVPHEEELAMGAVASGGVRVLNDEVLRRMPDGEALVEAATKRELRELQRRETFYREGRTPAGVSGRTIFLIDDGLATGSTMHAAVFALRALHPAVVVVAVPVAPPEACAALRDEVDEFFCLAVREDFHAVGQFYADFTQTTDAEVRDLLDRATAWNSSPETHS
jgi:predicted phosphoribosyltransferase